MNSYAFRIDQYSQYFYASDDSSTASFYEKISCIYFDDILIYSQSCE